jgi:channel protein (hemolysin III family)
VVAALGVRRLRRAALTPAGRLSLTLFGLSVVTLLSASALNHAVATDAALGPVFRRFDHLAIWFLIAATFTPVHMILFRGRHRWAVPIVVWSCSITGMLLKLFFFEALEEGLGLALYLAVGWVGAVSTVAIARIYSWRPALPLLVGGTLYTLGGLISLARAPNPIAGYFGAHEIFHVAVLAALYAHWRFMAGLPRLRRNLVDKKARHSAAGLRPTELTTAPS